MNDRLIHDCAWQCATVLVEKITSLLRPEEQRDALQEFYDAVRAAMEIHEVLKAREDVRLLKRPSSN